MIHWITEPWQYEFFRRGILAATMAGALTGLIGIYVVLRRMSYIGHGLSHAILGGTVVGYLSNYNFYVVGAVWGAVSALMVTGLARTRKIGADAAIGIVTTASYAIGIALISQGNHFTRNFEAAFFGNILGVTSGEVWVLAAVSVAVAAALFFLYKQLLFVTFDSEVAATYGVRTGVVDVVFALVLAAAIIATMRILGVTLIAAAIVTPAVVARLSTDSFGRMLVVSTVVGALSGFFGMYVSYHFDIASGATITLTGAAVFAVVYLVGLARGRWRSGARRRAGDGGLGPPEPQI